MSISLSDITEQFVTDRRDALQRDAGTRNTRYGDMIDLYRLDVWEDSPAPGERRVASPRAFTIVEAYRTLLFTRRPVLSVEASQHKRVLQQQADKIEKFLYGAWDEMRFLNVIDEVEFWACTAGRGVFKILYHPDTPEDEFPLMAQSIDPRNFYHSQSTFRPGEDVEVAHSFERTRRDIEQDWGEIPDESRPTEQGELEEWLDETVEYTDYWREVIVQEDKEEEEEPERGVMERVVEAMRGLLAGEEEEAEDEEPEKVWKRKVINCVVAGDDFVKDPKFVPGYERLPFFHWDGIHTPLPDLEDQGLSVLYPVAGGERADGTQGLLATENQLLAAKVRMVEMYANAAAVTNDESLADLDMRPGAVNVAGDRDYKLDWVMPPGQHPDADKVLAQLEALADDSTIPASMMGRYQGEISGVALSLMTNPVLMRIAARQRQREEVLQQANKLILGLVEEWAPSDGWVVWGRDKREREFEVVLKPDDINGYRRNSVKLSASLPKDAQGELMLHTNLVKQKMESRRTAINRIQELTDQRGRTPDDELKQILTEGVLFDEEQTRKLMAQRALDDYDPELAAELAMREQPQQAPQGPPQQPQGPMMGIPPQTVPPEFMGMGGAQEQPPQPEGRPPGG